MSRPPFEVADIIRTAGSKFRQRYWRALTWPQVKVLNAIVRCRTAALGGHRDQCDQCGYQAISFNSCPNRHCPKCQTNAREKWRRRRQQELLPVILCVVPRYVVFATEPSDRSPSGAWKHHINFGQSNPASRNSRRFDMFDKLFNCPEAVAQHQSAPLLEQRVRYLCHCQKVGSPRGTLRRKANELLVIIDRMNLQAERSIVWK